MTPPSVPARVVDRRDDQLVMRESARRVAVAATREAGTRGPLADVDDAGMLLGAPSGELMRLLGQLRSTVGCYVRERREAGLPVERVLPEVKGLVREASALEGWCDPADTLMAQVVRWTVVAYYDEPELAHGPRFY
jgi:hypothetical protein